MDLIIVLATLAALTIPAIWITREQRIYHARLKRLRPRNTTFSHDVTIRVSHPSKPTRRWTNAILFVTNKHIVAYATKGDDAPLFTCLGHEIEGFWRPKKYEDGINGIEIHAHTEGRWQILKIRTAKSRMMALVRVLKKLVNDDIIRAYRQQRPYIYRPPSEAQPAVQDLYGMWDYGAPFKLYLTPATLVFLDADDHVIRVIRLRDIQNIRVIKRGEDDISDGLVSFHVSSMQEDIAIAIDHCDAWAQSIATAARRTLEDPITRKQKAKASIETLDDDSDWDGDALDIAVWESMEYILGDDGELEPRRETV